MQNFTKEQLRELYSSSGDTGELKRRGLEFMVRGVLKPLVGWCNERMGIMERDEKEAEIRRSEDQGNEGGLGILTDEKTLSGAGGTGRVGRGVEDDPTAFESLRHRKQVLMEGVKRFNFKPKKVCLLPSSLFSGFGFRFGIDGFWDILIGNAIPFGFELYPFEDSKGYCEVSSSY